jgi:hypothetical protein
MTEHLSKMDILQVWQHLPILVHETNPHILTTPGDITNSKDIYLLFQYQTLLLQNATYLNSVVHSFIKLNDTLKTKQHPDSPLLASASNSSNS